MFIFFLYLQAQRPENTVMQALESLNDSQVNDFLSGKTPLNLSMRLGDHMMLIQLQLSTVNPTNSSSSSSLSSGASTSGTSLGASSHSSRDLSRHLKQIKSLTNLNLLGNRSKANLLRPSLAHHVSTATKISSSGSSSSSSSSNGDSKNLKESSQSSIESIEPKNNVDELRNIVSGLDKERRESTTNSLIAMDTSDNEQSPIKSLSNLVSSPMKAPSLKNIPLKSPTNNKHTSCPCKLIDTTGDVDDVIGCDTNCQYSRNYHQLAHKRLLSNQSELRHLSRTSALLHKTINNPISKAKSSNHLNPHHPQLRPNPMSIANLRRSRSSENISHHEQGIAKMITAKSLNNELAMNQPINIIDTTAGSSIDGINTSETLAEASRNLTKTLRKLSKEVFSSKGESSTSASSEEKRPRSSSSNVQSATASGSQQSSTVSGLGSGAVIESMRNHGRGIYSGTFSGTLNPALQDRFGRPKRDISTVIHILNDLLSATPHYSRGARISFEPAHSSRSSKYVSVTLFILFSL